MKRMDKEQWLNKTLQSLEGMQRIDASPQLYDALKSKLAMPYRSTSTISFFPKVAAAAALVLVCLNIASVLHFTHRQQPANENHEVYQVVKDEIKTLTDYNY